MNKSNIDAAIPFESLTELTPQDQFEILLYLYKQRHGEDALSVLLETYDLSQPRVIPGYGEGSVYAVTAEDIAYIYESGSVRFCFRRSWISSFSAFISSTKDFRSWMKSGISGLTGSAGSQRRSVDRDSGQGTFTDRMIFGARSIECRIACIRL